MTAKEYLNQARTINRLINVKKSELNNNEVTAKAISSPKLGDKVQTSSTNNVMRTVDKIIDLQNQIKDEINKLMDLKIEIRSKINCLDNDLDVVILTERCINCKTWQQIANDNHFDERHVRRLYGLALQSFRKKFDML